MKPTIEMLKQELSNPYLVQSFSGVRSSFGSGPDISDAHSSLATAYGFSYAQRTLEGIRETTLLLGRDPRPTGNAIAIALGQGFIAGAASVNCRVVVLDLGIITTPLLQTAIRSLSAAGGAMITASHNPLTDNGFKFLTGHSDATASRESAPAGALLAANAMAKVVNYVANIAEGNSSAFKTALNELTDEAFRRSFCKGEELPQRIKAERAYLDEVASEWGIQPHCLKPLVLGPVLLDPNGGAACGINARVLEHFGVRALEVNAELGYPEHSIDTDGIDPASGKHMLLRVARAALRMDARFGVAFDYDADRGNLVLPGMDESAIIRPQTIAAANIGLALSHREIAGRRSDKLAVVLSDSTSSVSLKVAKLFGAETFIVETGEVNVVTKMHQLRQAGYDVPIGVEGANGGTIFGNSTCRDGLQTALCAALADEQPALAKQWQKVLCRNGLPSKKREALRLPEILAAIPDYYNKAFRLQGPAIPHGELKARMEEHFVRVLWPKISRRFKSYRFANYEGTSLAEARTGDETGGWRLVLEAGGDEDFIFARGSRTEAGVWRIIVDSSDADRAEALAQTGLALFDAATDGRGVVQS